MDLMLSPLGLPKELQERTDDGLMTGWVWLWNYLNPHEILPHPIQNKRIAIYSGYLEELNEYIEQRASKNEKQFYLHVKGISKGGQDKELELINYLKGK